jgi:RimJ/RimL family protein N-acetyltransferase
MVIHPGEERMSGTADGRLRTMTAARGTQPVLAGSKVLLRPWTQADADDVYTACQDPEIQRWTVVPSPYTRADAVEFVTEIADASWRDGGAIFAVIETTTGKLVGSVGGHRMVDGVAHIGYWAVPAARGRGLTSDALRAVTRWLLREGGATRVELVVEPANTASIRVATAVGFTAEGVLRQRQVLKGRRSDVIMYSMLTSDSAAATL